MENLIYYDITMLITKEKYIKNAILHYHLNLLSEDSKLPYLSFEPKQSKAKQIT